MTGKTETDQRRCVLNFENLLLKLVDQNTVRDDYKCAVFLFESKRRRRIFQVRKKRENVFEDITFDV